MNQKTIKNITSITGFGIHTGVKTKLTLVPAKANSGIRFLRIDLKGSPVIKADVDNVSSTKRSTNLKKGNAEIKTVEHVLAAIAGANIDNLIIEVDNIEVPILDGSSRLSRLPLRCSSGKCRTEDERWRSSDRSGRGPRPDTTGNG